MSHQYPQIGVIPHLAQASVSEVRALATILSSEYAELERKMTAQMETLTLEISRKISSIARVAAQRSGEQTPNISSPGTTRGHGDHDNFTVLFPACSV